MYKNKTVHILHYWIEIIDCSCGCSSHTENENTEVFYDDSYMLRKVKELLSQDDYIFEYYCGNVQKCELYL